MPEEGVAGFWSYAHEDNNLDGGAILQLAQLLAEEFNLLSGDPFELFIDSDRIAWGDIWRERINSALAQTTFFIPIITPRYFKRQECRRELQEFAAKAEGLGSKELLLPVLYVEPQDFAEDSQDDLVALVAKTQYADWRENRLLDPGSRAYRKAVNGLALRLLETARKVAENQLAHEIDASLDDDSNDGITDLVEKITKLLPGWLEAVLGDRVTDAQIDATWHQCWGQVLKLRKSHAPASAITAAQMRAAREMLPLLERYQKDSRFYLARSTELDPLISALIRQVMEHPGTIELINPIREAIGEAVSNIEYYNVKTLPIREKGAHSIESHFQEMRHLGRLFQKSYAIFISGDRAQHEGNDIVERWNTELSRLDPREEQERHPLH